MIVVIQCANRKHPEAGFLTTASGRKVLFVAHPNAAPPSQELIYAHPDDQSDRGMSWRSFLLEYNRSPGQNPLHLYRSADLYSHPVYDLLVQRLGPERVYILSAGWGLISASFLTPVYDITFSNSAEGYKRRRIRDAYRDLCMLPSHSEEPITFFGGKDYLPLFCALTKQAAGPRTVFYASTQAPEAPGCSLTKYHTTIRTNWHYQCAKDFVIAP